MMRARRTRTHCAACGERLSASNCYPHPGGGWRSRCKVCEADRRREQRAREQVAHGRKLPAVCVICGGTEARTRSNRTVKPKPDWDPDDGRLRGVLCASCKTGLRAFDEDPDRLRRAAGYLEEHT
jgi:hypothetical protein